MSEINDPKEPLPVLPSFAPTHPKLQDSRLHVDPASNLPYLVEENLDEGKIRIIKINRLKAKNGYDGWLALALADALNAAAADPSVLVVILTGNGEYFSSGADLRAVMAGDPDKLNVEGGSVLNPVGVFMRTAIRFPKVLIAAVNGPAIGMG
jgi:enoyl-CoA hydratase/carnithine racemase